MPRKHDLGTSRAFVCIEVPHFPGVWGGSDFCLILIHKLNEYRLVSWLCFEKVILKLFIFCTI